MSNCSFRESDHCKIAQLILVVCTGDRCWLSAVRLGDGIGMFEKEDGNFLVDSLADIHCTMDAIGRLVPIHLSRCEADLVARASVTVFDLQRIAAEDDRYAMARVAMPGRGRRRVRDASVDPALFLVDEGFPRPQSLSRGLTLNQTDLWDSILY